MKILKLRYTISDIKILLDGLNNVLEQALEKVSKLVDQQRLICRKESNNQEKK